jgi:hypothetical protein
MPKKTLNSLQLARFSLGPDFSEGLDRVKEALFQPVVQFWFLRITGK